MPLKAIYEFLIFSFMLFWGVTSFLHGAAISFFINNGDVYYSSQVIDLIYSSVIFCFLTGLFFARITAFALIALSFFLIIVIYTSNGLAHGSGATSALVSAVILRPLIAGLLLATTPPVGPLWRLLRRKR